jgi:hypothetical protein
MICVFWYWSHKTSGKRALLDVEDWVISTGFRQIGEVTCANITVVWKKNIPSNRIALREFWVILSRFFISKGVD